MRKTTFEKLGIPYEERNGIFYPVLVAGTEKADIDVGKYGRMWIKYIKEEYPMRYKSLVRFGELEERADEVNDTAYELLDDIEAKWLKKHKPKNPNSFTEQLQLRTQTRMMAEEIVIMDVVMQFREVIDLVGRDKMQEELKNLQYGNCDISEWNGSNINPLENLNDFWLDSSLKISLLEQVEVLSRIFEGHSYYDSRNIEILKRLMLVDENDSQKIYGKTGSGNGEAWFVGFSESDGERKYIAIYLNDSEHRNQVSGNKAKEIALDILKDGF